jgi:hypothetical protein
MGLATRGLGPGLPIATFGLGPFATDIVVINGTAYPVTIQASTTNPTPAAQGGATPTPEAIQALVDALAPFASGQTNAVRTPGVIPVSTNILEPVASGSSGATSTPNVITITVLVHVPTASEAPDFALDITKLFTGKDPDVLERADSPVLVSLQNRKDIMADYTYRTDQSGPPIGFRWLDYTKTLINFTTGWTFELQLVTYTGLIEKVVDNTGITGGAGDSVQPNVVISWPLSFFTDVPPDQYQLLLKAIETASSKPRFFSLDRLPTLEVVPAPTVAP